VPEGRVTLSKVFASGLRSITATASSAGALAERIANDEPLTTGSTALGEIGLAIEDGRSAALGSGRAKAQFNGALSTGGRVGIYASGAAAAEALGIDPDAVGGLALKNVRRHRYAVMDWGYEGQLGGSLALSGGAAPRIEGDSHRLARFAVVSLLPHDTGARSILLDLLENWTLPTSICAATDLAPGTWIMAEVAGSIGVQVVAQSGFSIDRIRESSAHGLSGDLGLKVSAGIEATLGFRAAGRFLVVVSRESLDPDDSEVRVRVFKRARRGWQFAFNAGATFETVENGFLPESLDAFLGAIVGLDPNQVLDALRGLREWNDPAQVADHVLVLTPGEGSREAAVQAFFERLLPQSSTPLGFDAQRERIVGVLDKWFALHHEVATRLWSWIGHPQKIQRVRDVALSIRDTQGPDTTLAVRDVLERVGVEPDAGLAWIKAARGANTVAALLEPGAAPVLRAAAHALLEVLDEGVVQDTIVTMHTHVSKALPVQAVRDWTPEAGLESLDPWLRGRLAAFLDGPLDTQAMKDLGTALAGLVAHSDALYAAAKQAVHREYNTSMQVAYASASEQTALIDVTIDTASAQGRTLLAQAIAGRFDQVFAEPSPHLRAGVGELTHGTQQRLDVSISLPFFERSVKKLTHAVARLRVEAAGNGLIRLYSLASESVVDYDNATRSRLAVATLFSPKGSAVRRWTTSGTSTSYEYTVAKEDLLRPRLEQILRPFVETYFSDTLAPSGISGATGLSAWLTDIDRTVETLERNGSDNFGDVVLRLSVGIPPAYLGAWSAAKEGQGAAVYREMSVSLQRVMRRVLLSTLTADARFMNGGMQRVAGLLAYGALRADWGAALYTDGSAGWRLEKRPHWAWEETGLLEALVGQRETLERLRQSLATLHPALAVSGDVAQAVLKRLIPDRAESLLQVALDDIRSRNTGRGRWGTLQSLLYVEEQAIAGAIHAGQVSARFHRLKTGDPIKALEALAAFGTSLTSAFNAQLRGALWKPALPALSAELFMAAGRSFDPTLEERPHAVLELFVIAPGAPFPPADLGALGTDQVEGVLLEQRLVALGGSR